MIFEFKFVEILGESNKHVYRSLNSEVDNYDGNSEEEILHAFKRFIVSSIHSLDMVSDDLLRLRDRLIGMPDDEFTVNECRSFCSMFSYFGYLPLLIQRVDIDIPYNDDEQDDPVLARYYSFFSEEEVLGGDTPFATIGVAKAVHNQEELLWVYAVFEALDQKNLTVFENDMLNLEVERSNFEDLVSVGLPNTFDTNNIERFLQTNGVTPVIILENQ